MQTQSGRKPFRLLHPAWQLVTPPSAEPMSLVEAKLQCNRSPTETSQDLLWQRIIEGARHAIEVDLCRAVCWQRWKMTLDEWPDSIDLYRCPVIAVESLRYLNQSSVWTTVAAADYTVNLTEPAKIRPAYGDSWESPLGQDAVIDVTFTAGYLIPFTASVSTDYLTFTDYTPTNGDTFRLTNSGGVLPGGLAERTTYYVVSSSGSTCKLSLTAGGAAIDLTSTGIGLHFLGEVPQSLMQAMRKRVAIDYADREGSAVSAGCEASYQTSLRPVRYTVT